MEMKANDVFARYATLYFDQAMTSVYFFDTDYEGFGACFLVKKSMVSSSNKHFPSDWGWKGNKRR